MIKVIGVLLVLLSIRFFVYGYKLKDTSDNLTKVQAIGGAVLIAVLGISMIFTNKTFCEVFVFLCN